MRVLTSGRDIEKPHYIVRPFIAYPFFGCKLVGAGLVAGLILSGCTPSSQTFQRAQFIMGTTVEITVVAKDEANRTIYLPETGMKIDVGGIGKGYAADKAEAVLKHHGMTRGIVAVAGDLKVFGKSADGDPFRIAIRHPRKPEEAMGEVSLQNEAVSTSGDYERFFIHNGRRYHHILDPKTLYPATLSQSVTVIADRAIVTDALSTGIFVMGPRKGMALFERLPGIEGVLVDAKGNMSVSSGLQSRWRPLH